MQDVKRSPSEAPHRLLFRAAVQVEAHYSKKNSKTIGFRGGGNSNFAKRTGFTPFIRSKNKAANAESFLVSRLLQGERFASVDYPIRVPMLALFKFKLNNFYTKKGEVSLTAGDLTNILQGAEDSLQKAGIIANDALITKIIVEKEFGLENEIIIELLTNEKSASRPYQKKTNKS